MEKILERLRVKLIFAFIVDGAITFCVSFLYDQFKESYDCKFGDSVEVENSLYNFFEKKNWEKMIKNK